MRTGIRASARSARAAATEAADAGSASVFWSSGLLVFWSGSRRLVVPIITNRLACRKGNYPIECFSLRLGKSLSIWELFGNIGAFGDDRATCPVCGAPPVVGY